MNRVLRVVWYSIGAVAVAVVLVTVVFPTRDFIDQKEQIADTEATLAALRQEIDDLDGELATFSDPTHVERIAREQLSLVQPGDELYRLAVDPQRALDLPNAWPLPGVRKLLTGE
ncbi:MAG: septum formation initiator family protein [Acidimicrobiales bacterium]|jgi:cell division protein FtsL